MRGTNEHETAEAAHRSQAWTRRQPTERQIEYLPSGVRAGALTRYAASCYLAVRFNRRQIEAALAGAGREAA